MTNTEFIPWAKPNFWGNELAYVTQALSSTWISGGPFVTRFEEGLTSFMGDDLLVLVASNGTTALHMAYLALELKPADEVIVPGFAFMAAANMAIHLGAKPVFAEVDPHSWCLSAATIERCITRQTKLIVPVHTYGNVCPMDEINSLAKSRGIIVLEDAAEAFASRYKGHLAGSMSDIGTFSFQATKTITTGEGGMVVTRNKSLYDKMALYRSHGMLRKTYYWHELAGHNFRLTNLQAALGVAQLEKLDLIITERKRVHASYHRHLSKVQGVALQTFPPEVDVVLWAIAVKLDPKAFPQGRDQVIAQMLEAKIETRPGFYAASYMKHIYPECPKLPICEEISRQVISLPTYPSLTEEQIEFICSQLIRLRS